jgi:hypothetical protein
MSWLEGQRVGHAALVAILLLAGMALVGCEAHLDQQVGDRQLGSLSSSPPLPERPSDVPGQE